MPDQYRTIWISDLHLGTRAAKVEGLLHFLDRHEADHYYLVGDIVDGWALQRSWYWPSSHNEVLQALLDRAQDAEITYIPGNHDEAARQFPGLELGDITIQEQAVHTTTDGRRLLVLHGDAFDGVVRNARWLSKVGGWAYRSLLALNRPLNRVRRWLDKPHWSLAAAAKTTTKRAVQYIADFEQAVVDRAHREQVDGIVCGHIHVPELRPIRNVTYANTGDWVENCTALVEHPDGRLTLRRGTPAPHLQPTPRAHQSTGDGTQPDASSVPSPDVAPA
ncbi:MAG: UDP-2,3-diacylglucosamine diphosphatase [Bacteroidetes bacterium SW_9_63_38]|nr:MAG: UDP-2,3-diacylglucosamine diphosphatase [Bacteroidetes bacterium SW_9_63_38]